MIKLKSGREIDPKPLSWEDMAWVKDQSLKCFNEGITVSLFVCGKTLLLAKLVTSLEELKDWPDEDVYESAGKVIELNTLKDTQKKS